MWNNFTTYKNKTTMLHKFACSLLSEMKTFSLNLLQDFHSSATRVLINLPVLSIGFFFYCQKYHPTKRKAKQVPECACTFKFRFSDTHS